MNVMPQNTRPVVFFLLFLVAAALLCPPGTSAQPPNDKEVQETVTMWLMYKMRKDLEIPEKTCIILVEKIEACEMLRRNFFRLENDIAIKLENMLPNDDVDASEYKKLIDELDQQHLKVLTAEMDLQKELNNHLNPKQRARLILIMKDLRQRIHRILRSLEKRQDHRSRRRPSQFND